MKGKKINIDFISRCANDVGSLLRKIDDQFPPGNEFMLRHLGAASIHLNFFMRDLFEVLSGDKSIRCDKHEKQFVEQCGCDYKEKYK